MDLAAYLIESMTARRDNQLSTWAHRMNRWRSSRSEVLENAHALSRTGDHCAVDEMLKMDPEDMFDTHYACRT